MKNLLTESIEKLLIKRPDNSHKGMFGHSLIIGGSENYAGAPQFSASGAEILISSLSDAVMLSGCGTSAVLVPDFLKPAIYNHIKFSAIYSCKSSKGIIKYDENLINNLLVKTTCCAIGMGMGDGDSDKIVSHILEKSSSFVVIDADALKKCSGMKFSNRAVLTPHIGEFSLITGISKEEILANPIYYAKNYAKEHECVLVLKSHESVVTDGNNVYLNKSGNAKLSKGGSGDVLSGIICGILAFSSDPFSSAILGSYILGKCAENTSVNEFSCLPTDIIHEIPGVISSLL